MKSLTAAQSPQHIHPSSPASIGVQKIHPLTSLRFFAALYVVIYHTIWWGIPAPEWPPFALKLISFGFVSVSFFFMLSGYVLAIVYLRADKPVNGKKFFAARFARIYPLYFVMIVIDTPHLLFPRIASYGLKAALVKTSVTFLASILMVQSLTTALAGINPPSWSLSVEAFFYLMFPLVGVVLWRLRGAFIWATALFVYFAGLAMVGIAGSHIPFHSIQKFPLIHVPTFLLGVLLARWQHDRPNNATGAPAPRWRVYAVMLVAAIAFVATALSVSPRFVPYFGSCILAPLFGIAIWALSSAPTWISRALSVRWLVILGEASYGLYLIHFPMLQLSEYLHLYGVRALYPFYIAASIALSVLSFYFLETPARKWILKRAEVRSRETMELASDAQ